MNTAELQRYIDAGLSLRIRLENVPNRRRQLPRFRALDSLPGATRDGEAYAIPYTYSEMGLIYNRRVVERPPGSMAAMWDPAYHGKVLAFDASNHNFSIAALLFGAGSPFRLTTGEFDRAVEWLIAPRRNVLTFFNTPEEVVDLYRNHEIALIFGNYGTQQVKQLEAAGADIGYVILEEGALAWLDCWSVTRGVRDRDLAEARIDYTLEPRVSGALTERQGLANTITSLPTTRAEDRIIWLEPLEDDARR